jgi:hypothetical protein
VADKSARYAVVDIDGVLADVGHRLHHIERRPKDWDGFFAAAVDDPVLPEGLAVVRRLAVDHAIVYVTGRPERCRRDTVDWFARFDIPAGDLLMRRDRDHRPARQVKLGIVRSLAEQGTVDVVVDDDAAVCRTLRAAGFPVLEADWAREQPELFEAQEIEGRT